MAHKPMANPLDLSPAERDALRSLQEGVNELGADAPVWDGLEQFGLVESREKAHGRVLTPAGRRYPTQGDDEIRGGREQD
jgi:ribosomal protein S19E (S16A)